MCTYAAFVLGAGASQPFGLPIGRTLVDTIVSQPRAIVPSALRRRCFDEEEYEDFRVVLQRRVDAFAGQLANSGWHSIDRFVAQQPEHAEAARV